MLAIIAITSDMNNRHRKTLHSVFKDPAPAGMAWSDIESLLVAYGCRVIEGSGSRVRFEKEGLIASFHRPHPAKEAKRYQVEDARAYLMKLGITP